MRPGVDVVSRAQPLPRSAPTDTGAAFMVADTTTGAPVKLVRSLTEYENEFGTRVGSEEGYDAADAYFREGGAMLTVARKNAGGAAVAVEATTEDLSDASIDKMTRAELDDLAEEIGLDSASYPNVEAVRVAIRENTSPTERQVSGLASDYEASLLTVDAGIASALAALTKDLGPGQVFVADALASNSDTQAALLAHAAACNRVALIEAADGTATQLLAAATALRLSTNARYGGLFAPHAIIPGVAVGTTRTVPYAAVEAGMMARNDVAFNPNAAAAGDLGQAIYAIDITQRYSDAEYASLNAGGVDMARLLYNGVRTYGYRTLVDPAGPERDWISLGFARLNMAIIAQAEAIGEHYIFTQLDGRRRTISQFGGALRAMLVPFYEAGALYGATAEDAFYVDVGTTVNSEETIANGELHAVIEVRMSPFTEWVVIEIVKVATTQALAA